MASKLRGWAIRGLVAGGCAAAAVGVEARAQSPPQAKAQPKAKANYDEAAVRPYTLPDPLRTDDGRAVDRPIVWNRVRRPELLRHFESQVYGKTPAPPTPIPVSYRRVSEDSRALDGKAVRREIEVTFGEGPDAPRMDLLLFLPPAAAAGAPVPAFLGLNFEGNHAASRDPGVRVPTSWMRPKPGVVVDNRATEAGRAGALARWCVEDVVARGYALATVYYGDIDPDFDDGFRNGVHPLFYRPGQARPDPDQWGSIGAWAWGLSRALDYLEKVPEVDAGRVAVVGHSRLGKTALWAGAQDRRFAMVISNNSGEGGAALARRNFGEQTVNLNTSFPHWFCGNFRQYSGREEELPVDQHELLALIAPRPVLVSSAEEDRWADPRGEFLALQAASPVYELLGVPGLQLEGWPAAAEDSLSKGPVAYRHRPGKHDVMASDWKAYLDFADAHLKK